MEIVLSGPHGNLSDIFDQPQPNMYYEFNWDGMEIYGRIWNNSISFSGSVCYVYPAVYLEPVRLREIRRSFGLPGDPSVTWQPRRSQSKISVCKRFKMQSSSIEMQDAAPLKVGQYIPPPTQTINGWDFDIHQYYDPTNGVLWEGNLEIRRPEGSALLINTIAGNGWYSDRGDGGNARYASFKMPVSVVADEEGGFYVSDQEAHKIRYIDKHGVITTVAGRGWCADWGDGGPARNAYLCFPHGIALGPDGSLYIADSENHKVRRITPEGYMETVAGTGYPGYSGDGGLATEAMLEVPLDVAVAWDGSIYILHMITRPDEYSNISIPNTGNYVLRRVMPDGRIYTIEGIYINGDWPSLAADKKGNVYVTSEEMGKIYIITPEGFVSSFQPSSIIGTIGLTVLSDGSFFTSNPLENRVYRIFDDGTSVVYAGSGQYGYNGDGDIATRAQLDQPGDVAVMPDGRILIADTGNYVIRILAPGKRILEISTSQSTPKVVLPSEDGRYLYIFDKERGLHLQTLDAWNGVTIYEFEYNDKGQLVAILDQVGRRTRIVRDAEGHVQSIISPEGQVTTLGWDVNGYLSEVQDPLGNTHTFTYTDGGLMLTHTNPGGYTYSYSYDMLGRLTQTTDPAGGSYRYSLEVTNDTLFRRKIFRVTQTSAEGRVQVYERFWAGKRWTYGKVTFWNGHSTELISSHWNNRKYFIYADGMEMIVNTHPDPRFLNHVPLNDYTMITPNGKRMSITHRREVNLFNPFVVEWQVDTFYVNGRTYEIKYFFDVFSNERMLTYNTPEGRRQTAYLDEKGRIIRIEVPRVLPVEYTYNPQGRLEAITQGERVFHFEYDTKGRLWRITDPLLRVFTFSYDEANRLTNVEYPDTYTAGIGYDPNGNVTDVTPPIRPVHKLTYTPVNLLKKYIPPLVSGSGNNETVYHYNLDRQLEGVDYPDGSLIDHVYDQATGRLEEILSPDMNFSFTYYPDTGKLQSITTSTGEVIEFIWDGSLLTHQMWNGLVNGTVEFVYDDNFLITNEKITGVNGTYVLTYGYDDDELVTNANGMTIVWDPDNGFLRDTHIGIMSDHREYNDYGELRDYTMFMNGGLFYAYSFVHDRLGRISDRVETRPDGSQVAWHYEYDNRGRLWQVWRDGQLIEEYEYDGNGNRLAKWTPNGIEKGTYDDQDRLLSYGRFTYAWTPNGDVLEKVDTTTGDRTHYEYDVFGNLRKVVLPDGTVIEYIVDGLNRRIGKKVNGVLVRGWLYRDSINPIAELDGQGNVVAVFVYATQWWSPDIMIRNGRTYRFVKDHLGSIRYVVDVQTGDIVQELEYDAFGHVLTDTNPGFQPFGFAGGLYDPDTGLVRFGARDYDATTGRWTSKDPALFYGGVNIYTYIGNDPINFIDFFGLQYYAVVYGNEKGNPEHEAIVDVEKGKVWERAAGHDIEHEGVPYKESYACKKHWQPLKARDLGKDFDINKHKDPHPVEDYKKGAVQCTDYVETKIRGHRGGFWEWLANEWDLFRDIVVEEDPAELHTKVPLTERMADKKYTDIPEKLQNLHKPCKAQ